MTDGTGFPPADPSGGDGVSTPPPVPGVPPVPPPPAPPAFAGSTPPVPPVPPPYGSVPPYGQPTQGFGQPFAGQPGQPAATGPGYGPGYGPDYTAAPTQPAPFGGQPPSGNRKMIIILGVGIAAVALLVAAIVIIVNLLGGAGGDNAATDEPTDTTSTTDTTAEEEPAIDPAIAPVQRFFDALAAGDSRAATDQFVTRPTGSLINDDVLAYSNELGEIENLELTVTDQSEFSADVTATFTIGDDDFIEDFMLMNASYLDEEDAKFEILSGGSTYFGGMSTGQMLVNGVRVNDSGEALIGMYEVTAPHENFTVSGQSVFPLTSGTYSLPVDTELVLSDFGIERYGELVRDAVDECLASDTLDAGCNLAVSGEFDNGTIDDGTLVRTLSPNAAETLAQLEPRVEWGSTIVSSGYIGTVDVTGTCTVDGEQRECSPLSLPTLSDARIDMASDDPVISWE